MLRKMPIGAAGGSGPTPPPRLGCLPVGTPHHLTLSCLCSHLNASHPTRSPTAGPQLSCADPGNTWEPPPLQPQASGGNVGRSRGSPRPRCFLPPSSADPVDLFSCHLGFSPCFTAQAAHCRCPSGFGAFPAFAAWPVSPSETALLKPSVSTCLLIAGSSPAPPPCRPTTTARNFSHPLGGGST